MKTPGILVNVTLALCLLGLIPVVVVAQTPFVASTFPQDRAENLDCNFALVATLVFPSEATSLDPATLGLPHVVKLYPLYSPDSLISVLVEEDDFNNLRVISQQRLIPNTTYILTITSKLADSRGFAFNPVSFQFRTGNCEKKEDIEADIPVKPLELDPDAIQTLMSPPQLNTVEDSVQIRWQTEREFLTQYFLVQRADGDGEFNAIGKVRGAGESQVLQRYFWYDQRISPGTYRYRILAVDQLGGLSFSDTVLYYHEGVKWNKRLIPEGGPLQLTFYQATRSTLVALVYNTDREVVKRFAGFIEKGETNQTISLEGLEPGNYVVMLKTPTRQWVNGIRVLDR